MRRQLVGIAFVLLALPTGCRFIPHHYRFKMMVELRTPEGMRLGSSVYEVAAMNTPSFLPDERKRDWSVKGEAVAVDLPGNHTLFALMRTRNSVREDLARMSLAALDPKFNNDVVESAGRVSLGFGTNRRATVATDDYPLLVVFDDNSVAKSVKEVDPKSLGVIGRGYGPIRITVEKTNEPVTRNIDTRLPWLATHHGALIRMTFTDYPPPGTPLPLGANITERDFRQQ